MMCTLQLLTSFSSLILSVFFLLIFNLKKKNLLVNDTILSEHRSLEGLVRSSLLVTHAACCSSYIFSNSKVPKHLALRWLVKWCIRVDSFTQLTSFFFYHISYGEEKDSTCVFLQDMTITYFTIILFTMLIMVF